MRTNALISPGLVRGALLGALTLSAGCGSDATGSNNVITSTEVARVAVTPASATVDVGATVQLRAVTYDAAGAELQGKSIVLSSAASTVASVTSTGVVTGVTPGSTTIIATAEGSRGTADITVIPRGTSLGMITVNGAQQFQTMTGWEALNGVGHGECDRRAWHTYLPQVLDRAAKRGGDQSDQAAVARGL